MELTLNWKTYQELFESASYGQTIGSVDPSYPLVAVKDSDKIVTVFAPRENLVEWVGADKGELVQAFPHRDVYFLELSDAVKALEKIENLEHTHQEAQFLRNELKPVQLARTKPGSDQRRSKKTQTGWMSGFERPSHFLLEALDGWWKRVLPTSFGLVVKHTDGRKKCLVLIVRQGKLDAFFEPDLSILKNDQIESPSALSKYLGERYSVPFGGFF